MINWVMEITGQAVAKFKNATTLSRVLQTKNTAQDDTGLVQLFGMAGQDSNPPENSKAFVISLGNSWKLAIAVDDGITPDSEVGEYQIYSQAGGVKKAVLRLKPDGTISLGNGTDEVLSLLNDNLTEVITSLKYLRDTITFSNGGGPTGPPSNGNLLNDPITNLEATQIALGNILTP